MPNIEKNGKYYLTDALIFFSLSLPFCLIFCKISTFRLCITISNVKLSKHEEDFFVLIL